jgi:hypothetical protein
MTADVVVSGFNPVFPLKRHKLLGRSRRAWRSGSSQPLDARPHLPEGSRSLIKMAAGEGDRLGEREGEVGAGQFRHG